MRIREAMSPYAIAIESSDSIQVAARTMKENNVGMLPVIFEGAPIGTVTDRDLVFRALAQNLSPQSPVGAVMTSPVFTLIDDQEVWEALEMMQINHLHQILVCNPSGAFVGSLSLSDAILSSPRVPRPLKRTQPQFESLRAVRASRELPVL